MMQGRALGCAISFLLAMVLLVWAVFVGIPKWLEGDYVYTRFKTIEGHEIRIRTDIFCDLNGMYAFQGSHSAWHTYYSCGMSPKFTLHNEGQVFWITEKNDPHSIQFIEDYRTPTEIKAISAIQVITARELRYKLAEDYQYPYP